MKESLKEYGGFEEEKFIPLLEFAKKDPFILALSVYGSYSREESYHDIDICIFRDPNKANEIQDNSRHKLSILLSFPEIFDIHFFSDLPLYIRARVMKEGKILLNKDYNALFDIFVKSIKDYNLYKPHLLTLLGEN